MTFKKVAIYALFISFLSSAAYAQAVTSINTPFPELDLNSDGVISSREAKCTWLSGIFMRVDLDENGLISPQEYDQR